MPKRPKLAPGTRIDGLGAYVNADWHPDTEVCLYYCPKCSNITPAAYGEVMTPSCVHNARPQRRNRSGGLAELDLTQLDPSRPFGQIASDLPEAVQKFVQATEADLESYTMQKVPYPEVEAAWRLAGLDAARELLLQLLKERG